MSKSKAVAILGSTGSIGRNTLDVMRGDPGLQVAALSANNNTALLAEQCREFEPTYAVMADAERAGELRERLRDSQVRTEVLAGAEELARIAGLPEIDAVMAAIVGAAGLESTLSAIRAGKKVLLANKESLVMAGDLCMETARSAGALLIPVDSEHNAIFQCLPYCDTALGSEQTRHVRKLVLTCSGGPFLRTPADQFDSITPEQACKHPKWDMGAKISVDSATLMNKGLEVIEACYLFDMAPERVEVLIHPQSIVHSMVHFEDGSVLAQLRHAGHADSDRLRLGLAGAHAVGGRGDRSRRRRAARIHAARPRTIPLSRAGARSRAGAGSAAGGGERGQRSGGGRVSRGRIAVFPHCEANRVGFS